MASIALTIIRRISYLDIGVIFTLFFIGGKGNKKLSFLIPTKKPKMFAGGRWVTTSQSSSTTFLAVTNLHLFWSKHCTRKNTSVS
jgi:hypothetical protein